MFQVKREGQKMVCEHKEVLTDSQYNKLESEELQERIDAMCEDMHIERYIEDNGNVRISVISRTTDEFNDEKLHELDMTHTAFLSAIEKMELPTDEDADDLDDGEAEDEDIDAAWMEKFVENLEEIKAPCAAFVLAHHPIFVHMPVGMQLNKSTLIRICKCFIEHNK